MHNDRKHKSFGTRIAEYFGMGAKPAKKIKSAEGAVKGIREHGNKLPTGAGTPDKKKK